MSDVTVDDDLVTGARAIADALNEAFSSKTWNERGVYNGFEKGTLPVRKLAGKLVARRSLLTPAALFDAALPSQKSKREAQ